MRLIVEAWALLRMARRVESPALRRRLVADHFALLEEAWIAEVAHEPRRLDVELLVASGAIS